MTHVVEQKARLVGETDHTGIYALGEKESSGANYHYSIESKHAKQNAISAIAQFHFQHGNPADQVNGILSVDLLHILIDHIEGFQAGPYHSEDNAQALMHLKAALDFQQKRRQARVDRGVADTTEV